MHRVHHVVIARPDGPWQSGNLVVRLLRYWIAASAAPPDGTTGHLTIDPARLCLKSVRIELVEMGMDFDKLSPNGLNTSPCRINKAASCQVIGHRNDVVGCHRERSAAIQRIKNFVARGIVG